MFMLGKFIPLKITDALILPSKTESISTRLLKKNLSLDQNILHDFILESAEKVSLVFDEAWEYAPENEQLLSCYQLDDDEEDFYRARNLIDTLLFRSYLFLVDFGRSLKEREDEIIEKHDNKLSASTIKTYEDKLIQLKNANIIIDKNIDVPISEASSSLLLESSS